MSLQIRKAVRWNGREDNQGLMVCGRHPNGGLFGTKMFVEGRDAESYRIAELLRSRVINNENTRVEDWKRQ